MANPQKENGYVGIANDIFDQINFRDFNKNHLSAINLILRLTYGCNKKIAVITTKSKFQLYGINKNHVKGTLEYLNNNKVIIIEGNTYCFNKNYDEWIVPYKSGINFEEFNFLLKGNLSTKGGLLNQQNVDTESTKSVYDNPQKVDSVIHKKCIESSTKSGLLEAENSDCENKQDLPKDNERQLNTNKTTINDVVEISEKEFFVKEILAAEYKSPHFFTGSKLNEELRSLYTDLKDLYPNIDFKRVIVKYKNKDKSSIRNHPTCIESICSWVNSDAKQQEKRNNPPLPSYLVKTYTSKEDLYGGY